jgi:hypothetical protein
MNEDIRIAALRAASKLALGVTFVAGCSGGGHERAAAADGEALASNDESVSTTHSGSTKDGLGTSASNADADGGVDASTDAARPSCDALLTSTFADPAWNDLHEYRWEPAPVPATTADVEACCVAAFGPSGSDSPEAFRWECCNLLGNGTSTGPGAPLGCTPWGPPVPPAMRHLGVA